MRILLPLLLLSGTLAPAADQPLLLQKPTVSKTHIVFSYAGDLWSVPRDGGEAVHVGDPPVATIIRNWTRPCLRGKGGACEVFE